MKIQKVLALTLILFLFASVSLAQAKDTVDPGLTPDHPLYFLKTIFEKVKLFLTFDLKEKAKLLGKLVETKLAEAQVMLEKGKAEEAEKALDAYSDYMRTMSDVVGEAVNEGKDMEEVIKRVEKAHERHIEVLSELQEKVADEAKEAIEHALEVSQHGKEVSLEQLEKVNQKKVSGEKAKELEGGKGYKERVREDEREKRQEQIKRQKQEHEKEYKEDAEKEQESD